MLNKKFVILLLVLILIAVAGLVWAVLRAPVAPIPVNPGPGADNGFPLGDLEPMGDDSIGGKIEPGARDNNPGTEPVATNPSTNPHLQSLADQPIADFWFIPPSAGFIPTNASELAPSEIYYLTRRSAEIFFVPATGGEAIASTTAVKPTPDYRLINSGGGVEVVINNKTVFSSPLSNWRFSLPNPNSLLAQSTPTQNAPGTALVINPQTNATRRVLGDLNSLSAIMSPDGQTLLFSATSAGGWELGVLDLVTKQTSILPLISLAEKCAFAANSKIFCAVPRARALIGYPDAWYRGEVTSSDQIWEINPGTLETKLIFEGLLAQTPFDIFNLKITPDGEWAVFMTKGDWRGWRFDLRADLSPADASTTPAQ